ncbi:hypothetical protein CFO_g5307 [Ceratocystis platani]|uniref:Endonuclease/exonuclease/phosphatase domain-containing protein n=1 Tax=Ceratocystis fimbriata f. sp. platani TaxID=88771 RepID=A0A0F8CNP1_CERFI|nr:hypothetical protein CFO_g5307 [Ceratocystis platani]
MAATIVPISGGGHQDAMVVELAGQGLHIANVYNANPGDPERGIALKKTQETLRGKKMILCGDLNMHSQLWDSKKDDSSDCNQIHDWMEQEAVALLNEPDDNTCFSKKTSPSVIVGGSLPQGSPVSPILYMLYMAELFKKLPSLGYANDGLIYVSSTSVQTNITTLYLSSKRQAKNRPLYWTTIDGSIDEAKALLPHPIRDSTKLRQEQEGPAESLAEKLSKEEAAKAHLDLLSKESQEAMWAYSDGSRNGDGDTGAGWAVYFRGKILAQGNGSCGRYREVADAEAIARLPGHCEVPGNEAVDQLAKAGCKSEDLLVPKATMSLTAARRWRNEAFKADFRNWMKENCPKIKRLGGALNWPRPYDIDWMKGLHRGTVARIPAARSGHGDFKEYHVRLSHRNAEIRCPTKPRPLPTHGSV